MAKKRERLYAIIIGGVMIFSMAGFAMSSMLPLQSQNSDYKIPSVIDKPLTKEEKLFVLRSGRSVIEHFYRENCTDCLERDVMLKTFTESMSDYVVFSHGVGNETVLKMTSPTGEITELESNITQDYLLGEFCETSYIKPKPCLIMEI